MPRKYPQSTWMNLLASAKNFFWKDTPFHLSQTHPSASKQNGAPFHTRFTPKTPRSSQRPTSTFHPHSRVAQPVDRGGCLLSINVVISTSKLWSCARLVHNSICQGLGRSVIPLVHKPTIITFSSFKKFIFIVSCGQPFWMLSQADTRWIACGLSLNTRMARWPAKGAWSQGCRQGFGRVTASWEN